MSKPISSKMKKNQSTSTKVQSIVKNTAPLTSHGVNSRSAAEACMNSGSKYRQLPCKTFISVGTCPFGERCVFLHDPRLICPTAHSITRQKNKEDNAGDTLFWPVTSGEVSTRNLEHNFHSYSVPVPKNDQYKLHDQALYSLWMHYVEFCKNNTAKTVKTADNLSYAETSVIYTPRDVPVNMFIHTRRLPVFQLLSSSEGEDIMPEQFELATAKVFRAPPQPMVAKPTTPPLNMAAIQAAMAVVNKHKVNKLHLSPTSISAESHAREMGQFMRSVSPDHHYSSSGHTSHANSFSACSIPYQQQYQQSVPHQYQVPHAKSSRYQQRDEEDDGDLSSLSSAEDDCAFSSAASGYFYEQQQGQVRFPTSYPHQQQYANFVQAHHVSQELVW